MISGNSKETYNALKAVKAVTNTQQDKSAVIEDSREKIPTESKARWTKHCSGLYNYELPLSTNLLQSSQTSTQEAESLPVLREEVEEAAHSLKAVRSSGMDSISSELFKNGGEATTAVLTAICKKIWETK